MSITRHFRILLAVALLAVAAVVALPRTDAAAEFDVYSTPGYHTINGRQWHTWCEPYSQTERCHTNILATQVRYENGAYVQSEGWVFNNLTYLSGLTRAQWVGNPLGANGSWTAADGRQWYTECDTAATGRGGCRSYIYGQAIGVVSQDPTTYGWVSDWIFNSMVRFKPAPAPTPTTPPPGPCNDAWIPSGFAITKVDGKLVPHAVKTPYEPNTLYNPTSISNFTRHILRNSSLRESNRTQWECLLKIGTDTLLDGSTTQAHEGETVRWFPYMFPFDPSEGAEVIQPLEPGWISGLAQGAALGLMAELHTVTGDEQWQVRGEEILASFRVPFSEGGFTHRDHGFLWFEEYPSNPPTTVLNGHLEAIIGLDIWARHTGDEFTRELFNEALTGLEDVLPEMEVPVQGGILTSYDLVRMDHPAPLRFTREPGSSANITGYRLNGEKVDIPFVDRTSWTGRMLEPFMAVYESGQHVNKWASIAPQSKSTVSSSGLTVKIRSDKENWQGIQQLVPASRVTPGTDLTLQMDSRLTLTDGVAGLSGRIAVYEHCQGKATRLVHETQKNRGQTWATYTTSFTADVDPGCGLLVQLLTGSYGLEGTTVEYRNISLGEAQELGSHHDPSYGLYVHDTPDNAITVSGSGSIRVQAYMDGMWHNIQSVSLGSTSTAVEVPPIYTDRNIHYGYHETHVAELSSLYTRAIAAGFTADQAKFLRDYAVRWEAMAPSQHGKIPRDQSADNARMRTAQTSELDSYELPLFDPFQKFYEE
ncbi:D-glucuronyl C5-epimerase family protein [Tessaracoccus rhinocerotis]|nr:D-glucuronyl C5-epimerase family protein [Tessaracoccus rhinocerotis]